MEFVRAARYHIGSGNPEQLKSKAVGIFFDLLYVVGLSLTLLFAFYRKHPVYPATLFQNRI